MRPSRNLSSLLSFSSLVLITACSSSSSGGAPALARPGSLRAEPRASSALLVWEDLSAAETRYLVQSQGANGEFTNIALLPADSTQYLVTALTPSEDYVFRVAAESDPGVRQVSESVAIRTGVPALESVVPASAFVVGGQRLRLYGDGLSAGVQQVLVGGRVGRFEVVSDTEIDFEMPAIREPGLTSITLQTRYGNSELTDAVLGYAWPPALASEPRRVAEPVTPEEMVTAGSGNTVHALWVTPSPDRQIWVASSREGGAFWREPVRVDVNNGRPFEPHIHVDGDLVCAAWVDLGGLITVRSQNGGVSWGAPTRIPVPPADGTVFHPQVLVNGVQVSIFWVDARPQFGRTFVVHSMDRGDTYGPIIQVNDALEAERLAVTRSGSNYYVAVWSAVGGGSVHVSRSGDRGASWALFSQNLQMVPGSNPVQPQICASGDWVHVTAVEQVSGRVAVASSANAGNTFGEARLLDRQTSSISSSATIACSGADVCVAWHEAQPDGRASVECSHSLDGGISWSRIPRQLPMARDSLGTRPQVACDGTHVSIAWVSGLPNGESRAFSAVSENRTASFEVQQLGTEQADAVSLFSNGGHQQLVWRGLDNIKSLETTPNR